MYPSDDDFIDKLIAATAMLVGLLLYGYCVALLAATLTNIDVPRVQYQEHLFTVKNFMKNMKLDKERRNAVRTLISAVLVWSRS